MASDLVWTKHIEQRLRQRGVSRNEAFDVIRHPDQQKRLNSTKWKFTKKYPGKQITLITSRDSGQWVILTSWSKASGQRSWPGKSLESPISRWLRRLIFK